MRPLLLEFCGINSFSEPAAVDFKSLLEFGIFGIFGDTGSGKSTILDCIGFALYGDIARSRAGTIGDAINFRCEKAYVNFEFEIFYEDRRRIFRAERELKRKKDSSEQVLTVYEREEGKLIACAEGVRDGNAFLKRVIGLEQKDFEKCIALPQGEFSQFVKAPRAERLRIISRLFDLERYGEGLVKRVNGYSQTLAEETRVLSARLEPYADVTKEGNARLEEEIVLLAEREKRAETELAAARAEEARLNVLYEKYREYTALSKQMELLETQREGMTALADELGRLSLAGNAVKCAEEQAEAEKRKKAAEEEYLACTKRHSDAVKAKESLAPFDAERTDGEISRLERELARAEEADAYLSQAKQLEKTIAEDEKALSALRERSHPLDYAAERAGIEKTLASMPEADFAEFFDGVGKEALLREEYAAVHADFVSLERSCPELSVKIRPYLEKYAALAAGERADFSGLKALFEARERAKKAAQDALLLLEKRHSEEESNARECARLQQELARRGEELSGLRTRLAGIPPRKETEQALAALKKERKANAEQRAQAEKSISDAAVALAAARATCSGAEETLRGASGRLAEALGKGSFSDAEEATRLIRKYGDMQDAAKRVAEYRELYAHTARRLRELSAEDLSGVGGGEPEAAKERAEKIGAEAKALTATLALSRERAKRDRARLIEKEALEHEYRGKLRDAEVAERLKKLLRDNKFMEFVAEEYLQTIAVNASARLLSLTDGRYFLRYDGGFFVGDNFNGGEKRSVCTLSGGETFLVSLSLALALSTEICARSARPIEFFFLDEGFGTLDGKLVDTVMDSLEKLKNRSFSIGIISHVEELKHRIDRKLLVRGADERSGSQISLE